MVLASMDTATARLPGPATIRLLLADAHSADERAYFWLRMGEQELTAGNFLGASIAYDTLAAQYPGAPFADRIDNLHRRITRTGSIVLGVLLPLMKDGPPSAVQELGNELYEGIAYAAEQAGADPGMRVRVLIDTRDTERETRTAVREVAALAADPSVIGILGPVFSPQAMEAALAARDGGIPLVTPTANANGIAAVGPGIFQLNPDYETRGRAMARYAVLRRGYSTFAVLAPSDTYARQLAESFVAEVRALGATVVASEWYERGTSDLKPQLSRIRRAALHREMEPLLPFGGNIRRAELMKLVDLGVPLRRIDSLMARGSVVPAALLLGPGARHVIDSLQLPVAYDESRLDSLEFPTKGVDALYVPISSPDEIGVVSSQIVYFNFEAQLLGSGEWDNPSELFANKRYCDGLVFETDVYIDTEGAPYRQFAEAFTARFGKRPTKNTLYGYDAMACVLSCIRNGARTREALVRALAALDDYRGLHSLIGFTPGGVNGWLTIVGYAGDSIRRLDEYRVE
jgi:ABC-type branched-subunit amino acid transport system substrate-binding protein